VSRKTQEKGRREILCFNKPHLEIWTIHKDLGFVCSSDNGCGSKYFSLKNISK
jgi:hypothetical protein